MILVLVINFKMPTIVSILKYMTRRNDNACSSEEEDFHIYLQFDTYEGFKLDAHMS